MLRGGLFPHPPIIIPEIGGERRRKATDTISACKKLAGMFVEQMPDLVIAVGPHGPTDHSRITISAARDHRGDLGYFGAPDINFTLEGCPEMADNIEQEFASADWQLRQVNRQKSEAELDHGIMVPLYFLEEAGLERVPWLILNMTFWEPQKLYSFGEKLANYVKEETEFADPVFLVSGDLSHRTEPGAPGGYSPAGEEFDRRLMGLLAENDLEAVLKLDQQLIKDAGECGYRPLLIGLGFSEKLAGKGELDIEVLSYEAPFGVGYGVAQFRDGR